MYHHTCQHLHVCLVFHMTRGMLDFDQKFSSLSHNLTTLLTAQVLTCWTASASNALRYFNFTPLFTYSVQTVTYAIKNCQYQHTHLVCVHVSRLSLQLRRGGGELSTSSLVPSPHLRERVWWHPADTSGFINIDYFLERKFSPLITLQKRQSVVQHWKFLATSADDTALFLVQISYQFLTMHTASYELLMKPKESAGCHQTLSLWVGSGEKTRVHLHHTCDHMGMD